MDLLPEALIALRLGLLDGGGHLLGDAGTLAHCIVEAENVAFQVADLTVHQVDEGDCLGVSEGFLQLHFLSCVHGLAELAPEDIQDLRHTQELVVGVEEGQAQRLAALGGRPEEGFVLGARLAAAHGGLEHAQHGELLLQGDLCRGGRCTQCLDRLGHTGTRGLKGTDALSDTRREDLSKLQVGKIIIVTFVNAVARGKEGRHLSRRGLSRLCRQGSQAGKLGYSLIGEGCDAAFDVIGRADEVSLRRPRPLIGEAACGVLYSAQIPHTQGGQLADGPAGLEGCLHRSEGRAGDLRAHFLHDRAGLGRGAKCLAQGIQPGDVRPHLGGDAGHGPAEVVDHVHHKRQLEYGL